MLALKMRESERVCLYDCTLLSNTSGPELEQRSSFPLSQQTGDKPCVVTRSGRISKPPERLQY